MVRHVTAAIIVSIVSLGASPKPAPPQSVASSLTSIREARTLDLAPQSEDRIVFDHEKPGLTLAFRVEPPRGLRLLEILQPERVVANDSTGRDLTGIEPGFDGELEFVTLEDSFGDAPAGFSLHLTPAARAADAITVGALFDAVFFSGTTTESIEVGQEWMDLPHSLTSGEQVRVRLASDDGQSQLEMQPGTAKERFESVTMLGAEGELEGMGVWWSGAEAAFLFAGSPEDVTRVRFTARTGLRTLPVVIRLDRQALP